ncbi:proprotein convertase P-domain-containing protein, partial [bacterium]|nr:proprotein convertase P-domain-containing protein [bacterium]
EPYDCLNDVLPVTGASDFLTVDVDASVASIGLYGALTPYYEGLIEANAFETGFYLKVDGCGVNDEAFSGGGTTASLLATPTSTGTISAAVCKKGYNVYLEEIDVQVVYGQLAGSIFDEASAPIVGAVVKGYPAGSDTTGADPIFDAVSEAFGAYTIEGDLDVDYYDVYVSKFGYLTAYEETFIQYGANALDFYLDFAPSGVVSGTVTETGTGVPLEATVKVYRADNGDLYAETTSDPATGAYAVTLPYFNYQMNVRAYHHIPENRGISVSTPAMTEDFVLDVTLANILVIADGAARQEDYKIAKDGTVLEIYSGISDDIESASQIATDLIALGYDVTEETAPSTDPGTWLTDYDFIISASGDNTAPVVSAAYRTALESYVAAGGKLLLEGGEVAYDAVSHPGYPTFAANVCHSYDWNGDSSGNLTVYDPTHPVTSFPNTIGTITFNYSNYGDQDASLPTADASIVCSWTSHPSDASIIVYDDNVNPQSGQIVFFQFDYLAGEATGVMALLENTVTYLMTQENPPDGAIAGQVCLEGMGDHSGILVTVSPGTQSAYTSVAGYYAIEGLYDATYTIEATKPDWSTGVVEGVVVSGGMPVTGVDMMLFPVTIVERCNSPALSIPDDAPAGVYDTITFPDDISVTDIEVYINITHTYIGDLIAEVTSPEGTTVRLHNRTGSSSNDIVGWYDTELTVDGPGALLDFVGESSGGDWTLWVSDNAGADLGTVNEWCVEVEGGSPTGVDDEPNTPAAFVLRGVSPNPF